MLTLYGLVAGVPYVDGKSTFDSTQCTDTGMLNSHQFRAKNWGGTNDPVTRARLVSQLGKRIAEFIEVRFNQF